MRYLIIGGAGVFAIHTIKAILNLKSTSKVISVGRSLEKSSAFTLNIGKDDKKFFYKQIHLTFETDKLVDLIDYFQPNYIINFAALAHSTSWYKSFRYYDTNILALSKICEYLYDKKFLKQFLQVGSSEIYGPTVRPALENNIPNPTSPYAISKLAADYHILSCYNVKGLPGNIIRPCNCYGPGQLLYRIIPKAILLALNNKQFPLEGGGKSLKSYMYVSDLADAIIKILNSRKFGQIFNAGVDKTISMKNIIKKICFKLSIDENKFIKNTKPRIGEDKIYWVNSNKIKKELKWKPKISIDEGLDNCINWITKYKDQLNAASTEFELRA
jgi:dTDP-glucose 4,6-dehydratase